VSGGRGLALIALALTRLSCGAPAVIDTTGRVEEGSIRVIESTDPRFNEAAKSYVGGARFSAGRVAGRAVRVRFQIPVDFRLPSRH